MSVVWIMTKLNSDVIKILISDFLILGLLMCHIGLH